jgi:RND family efflux transporter MFP subunit
MTWICLLPRRLLTLFVVALLAAFLIGCRGDALPSEEEHEHAAPVKWEPAEKADLEEWTELLGTTQPLLNRVARVSAAVEGHVLAVLPQSSGKRVVEGQHVEAGQILVRLDDRIIRANRDKLVAGKAELKEQIQQASNAVALAQIDIDRLEKLLFPSPAGTSSVPLVSRIELDKARLMLKDAESKHKGILAKEGITRAELKALDEQLSLYTLRAPIAGQLGLVHAVPGQTLPVGTVVAEVIDLDAIDVLCFVPARTVSRLQLDQPVRLEDASEVDKDEPGRIIFISDQAQAETGTIAVKARFSNRSRKLRANTLRRLRVLTRSKPDCLTIPESALLEDQEEPAVLVAIPGKNEKGEDEYKVHKYQVKLGLRDKEKHKVEILGLIDAEKKTIPLEKTTLFVVEGGHGLEEGDQVVRSP